MHYASIRKLDIANGDGVRVSLFVSGCRNHCKNCFQPETWDFEYGQIFDDGVEAQLLEALAPSYVDGLTLLGGEPFEPENQRVLAGFLSRMRKLLPRKNVWCYTGYTLEQILSAAHPHCECTEEMLGNIDVLVDGRFVEELKDISLKFRGSANQRIIDLPRTLESGKIVLLET